MLAAVVVSMVLLFYGGAPDNGEAGRLIKGSHRAGRMNRAVRPESRRQVDIVCDFGCHQSTTLYPRLRACFTAVLRSRFGFAACHADLLHSWVAGDGSGFGAGNSPAGSRSATPPGPTLKPAGVGGVGCGFAGSGGLVRCEAVSTFRGGAVGALGGGTP